MRGRTRTRTPAGGRNSRARAGAGSGDANRCRRPTAGRGGAGRERRRFGERVLRRLEGRLPERSDRSRKSRRLRNRQPKNRGPSATGNADSSRRTDRGLPPLPRPVRPAPSATVRPAPPGPRRRRPLLLQSRSLRHHRPTRPWSRPIQAFASPRGVATLPAAPTPPGISLGAALRSRSPLPLSAPRGLLRTERRAESAGGLRAKEDRLDPLRGERPAGFPSPADAGRERPGAPGRRMDRHPLPERPGAPGTGLPPALSSPPIRSPPPRRSSFRLGRASAPGANGPGPSRRLHLREDAVTFRLALIPPRDLAGSGASELATSLSLPAPGGLLRTERRAESAGVPGRLGMGSSAPPDLHRPPRRAGNRVVAGAVAATLHEPRPPSSSSPARSGVGARSERTGPVPAFASPGEGGYSPGCSYPPRDLAGSSVAESLSVAALGPRGLLRSGVGAESTGGCRTGGVASSVAGATVTGGSVAHRRCPGTGWQ